MLPPSHSRVSGMSSSSALRSQASPQGRSTAVAVAAQLLRVVLVRAVVVVDGVKVAVGYPFPGAAIARGVHIETQHKGGASLGKFSPHPKCWPSPPESRPRSPDQKCETYLLHMVPSYVVTRHQGHRCAPSSLRVSSGSWEAATQGGSVERLSEVGRRWAHSGRQR